MIKFLILTSLFICQTWIEVNAQVDTAWVKRINGSASSEDRANVIKVDDSGYVYVGGKISRVLNYPDFAFIKYKLNGDTLWVKFYDSPVNYGGELKDMAVDNYGNIIVTGNSAGNNYDDYATIKYDTYGNVIWIKRFDKGDSDQPLKLLIDDDGNVYITGVSSRVNESHNFLTIKYNSNGDTIWTRSFVGNEDASDIPRAIALDSQGNVFVGGETDWRWGTPDFVTIKYYPSGGTAWIAQYNGSQNNYDYFRAMALDGEDNIIVTGDFYSSGTTDLDIVIIKYDNITGNTIWVKKYKGTGTGDDSVRDIIIDSLGNIYLTGSTFVSGTGYDFLTMKFNPSGELQWTSTYAGRSNYNDDANSIALDRFGNVYVTGKSWGYFNDNEYATIKYDNNGNEKWAIRYRGVNSNLFNNVPSDICVDNTGNVYITGSSQGINTGYDIVTIKYVQTPSSLEDFSSDFPATFSLYQNYPNPFNPTTKIRFTIPLDERRETKNVSLKIYDILGREVVTLVNEDKPSGSYEVEFNPASSIWNLASGIYFYQLKVGDYSETKKMIYLK
jgi:hypothetical protein